MKLVSMYFSTIPCNVMCKIFALHAFYLSEAEQNEIHTEKPPDRHWYVTPVIQMKDNVANQKFAYMDRLNCVFYIAIFPRDYLDKRAYKQWPFIVYLHWIKRTNPSCKPLCPAVIIVWTIT